VRIIIIYGFFAASLMKSGVLKSGSPKLNEMISSPFALSSRLMRAIANVADSDSLDISSDASCIVVFVEMV